MEWKEFLRVYRPSLINFSSTTNLLYTTIDTFPFFPIPYILSPCKVQALTIIYQTALYTSHVFTFNKIASYSDNTHIFTYQVSKFLKVVSLSVKCVCNLYLEWTLYSYIQFSLKSWALESTDEILYFPFGSNTLLCSHKCTLSFHPTSCSLSKIKKP